MLRLRSYSSRRDEINFARVAALNDQEYRNNLALASYAYDRDLDLASDVAMGGLFGSIAGGIVGAVFKKALKEVINDWEYSRSSSR
jgi:hypothetical protein